MLERYRSLSEAHPWDWAGEFRLRPILASLGIRSVLPPAVARLIVSPDELGRAGQGLEDLGRPVRDALEGQAVPAGVVAVRVGDGAVNVAAGAPVPCIDPAARTMWLLVDSRVDRDVSLTLAGVASTLPAYDAMFRQVRLGLGRSPELIVDGAPIHVPEVAVDQPVAMLRVCSDATSRWSVVDETGTGWFPAGVPRKWDYRYRPFFHGGDLVVRVPAGSLEVTVGRGLEFEDRSERISLAPGETRTVRMEPRRWIDLERQGWYGADMHVHMNMSGGLVISPTQARAMQLGEGLHLMNLLAANMLTDEVFDRDALEAAIQAPDPETERPTAFGVEYRNDLLGHLHALGLTEPPRSYQSGHQGTRHDEDWPSNASACVALRQQDAVVGYCHPVSKPFSPSGDPRDVFEGDTRSGEARELVVDAALGLIDAVELLSCSSTASSTMHLYHRLLGCGLRLAASVGTDTFLSVAHGFNSDPPGWARVYADLGRRPPTLEAFKDAIRRGATVATNGPWVTLRVNGHGPGSVVEVREGEPVNVNVEFAARLPVSAHIMTDEGIVASDGPALAGTVAASFRASGPRWLAAVVPAPESEPGSRAPFAHTTPVYIDVDGRRVRKQDDAAWCLDWLERLERLLDAEGRFRSASHRRDVAESIAEARRLYAAIVTGELV